MLEIDTMVAVASGPAGRIRVTPNEITILQTLLRQRGNVLPTPLIIAEVWRGRRRPAWPVDALRVHVADIRRKLMQIGFQCHHIEGDARGGYCIH